MAFGSADRWFFDTWSLGYDQAIVQRLAYRPVHDAVLRALGAETEAARVLDLGCGTGELTRRLTQAFPHASVVGCDFSTGMLRRAAAKTDAAYWVRGDACRLPFGDGVFDAIVSTEAFHWFPDQARALNECRRVLMPGGRLLLALVSPPLPFVSSLAHVGSRLIGQPFYWPTQAGIRAQLENAGFEIELQQRVFRFPGLLLLPLLTTAVSPERRHRHRSMKKSRPSSRRQARPPTSHS